MGLKLLNSLTGQKEVFEPISKDGKVGVYACGPTVYSYLSVGNWRTFVLGDLLVRSLKHFGYEVDYVMNITDVGHLTGDNLGDADTGEDKLEKAAERESKTAWDIAEFYTKDFMSGYERLNLAKPSVFSRATEHISEQIELIGRIEKSGLTYKTSDGIYFDVAGYEKSGNKYGELSNIDQVKEGARVEPNREKKDPRDFALWKFSYPEARVPTSHETSRGRHMEWDSPWAPPGVRGKVKGFPGWHIECSAMSMKYLGEQFDIHIGGEDLRSTHHPNEIAQSEAATGKKPFVKYWLHGAFVLVDGGRMGKSLGNAYTLDDIQKKGFEPLALKYLYLTTHYRKQLNFTWDGLTAAAETYRRMLDQVSEYGKGSGRTVLSEAKLGKVDDYRVRFDEAVGDDLNMPRALAVAWEAMKSNIPSSDKYELMLSFDEVLGLGLGRIVQSVAVPADVEGLAGKREEYRKKGDFEKADEVRGEIENMGFVVRDTSDGPKLAKKR